MTTRPQIYPSNVKSIRMIIGVMHVFSLRGGNRPSSISLGSYFILLTFLHQLHLHHPGDACSFTAMGGYLILYYHFISFSSVINQRTRERWPNIKPSLIQRLALLGILSIRGDEIMEMDTTYTNQK